jgi:Protein of unknown function (DUF3995)
VRDGLDRVTAVAAVVAAILGVASAAVSAYWVLGGEALLDTVGGEIERWARERSTSVLVTLWTIVVLKLLGAGAPLVFAGVGVGRLPAWASGRWARAIGWLGAVALTLYGGVLTVAGLLVETGVLDPAEDADERALAWHAYLWDPWFALWGAAWIVVMWRSRA